MSRKLIIFDYSGTLSLAAVRFGRPERLAKALGDSGLADLGIDAAAYWRDIVTPTWHRASTTPEGFAPIMARQVHTLAPAASAGTVSNAARRFLKAYLDSAAIEPQWTAALTRLRDHPQILRVVATDHYPEATAAIIGHLGALNIPARSATAAAAVNVDKAFIVANSADIGYHKRNPLFWQMLKSGLGRPSPTAITLVEDFGANETDQDGYAASGAVVRRETETTAALGRIFDAPIAVVSLAAEESGRPDIESASRRIERFLAAP